MLVSYYILREDQVLGFIKQTGQNLRLIIKAQMPFLAALAVGLPARQVPKIA